MQRMDAERALRRARTNAEILEKEYKLLESRVETARQAFQATVGRLEALQQGKDAKRVREVEQDLAAVRTADKALEESKRLVFRVQGCLENTGGGHRGHEMNNGKERARYEILRTLHTTRVPIVTFRDMGDKRKRAGKGVKKGGGAWQCDLCINNIGAVYNTGEWREGRDGRRERGRVGRPKGGIQTSDACVRTS
jgi:hypothetical protein